MISLYEIRRAFGSWTYDYCHESARIHFTVLECHHLLIMLLMGMMRPQLACFFTGGHFQL